MNFLKFALGYQWAGSVVVVELDGAASDVFLVDDLNLRKLERGDSFTYYGGHATTSPVRLYVPSAAGQSGTMRLAGSCAESPATSRTRASARSWTSWAWAARPSCA